MLMKIDVNYQSRLSEQRHTSAKSGCDHNQLTLLSSMITLTLVKRVFNINFILNILGTP